jgi:hypothetical protein
MAKASGCLRTEKQLRRLKSNMHIFGTSYMHISVTRTAAFPCVVTPELPHDPPLHPSTYTPVLACLCFLASFFTFAVVLRPGCSCAAAGHTHINTVNVMEGVTYMQNALGYGISPGTKLTVVHDQGRFKSYMA